MTNKQIKKLVTQQLKLIKDLDKLNDKIRKLDKKIDSDISYRYPNLDGIPDWKPYFKRHCNFSGFEDLYGKN